MNIIKGGVTAPKGFKANAVLAGIKKGRTEPDLMLLLSEKLCNTAAVYTKNLVQSGPIYVTKKNLENGISQAVICNSGNANTCNADAVEIAEKMCEIAAEHTGIKKEDVIVASTGVIGQNLNITPIKNKSLELAQGLSTDGSDLAARAIMTTDTFKKECAVQVELGGKTVSVGGIAKGSGMIHPNMATMLCFVTSDCKISSELLKKLIKDVADDSFNMVSVDGDTSTNDTLSIMCNGMAENEEITTFGEDYTVFYSAVEYVCLELSKLMAADGEGATKLIICETKGAKDKETAKVVAKSVICSSLFKAAMFGEDANWGRILCAIGYSGADVDVNKIDVSFKSTKGTVMVCENGSGLNFSEEKAAEILAEKEIEVIVELKTGEACAKAFGCDLTYDYVKINGDYRT